MRKSSEIIWRNFRIIFEELFDYFDLFYWCFDLFFNWCENTKRSKLIVRKVGVRSWYATAVLQPKVHFRRLELVSKIKVAQQETDCPQKRT
jgi:hypothetical protein